MQTSTKQFLAYGRNFACAALLSAFSLQAAAQSQAHPALTYVAFDRAVQLALEQAPSLRGRTANIEGFAALQASAAQLPDPKISLGLDSLPVNGPNRGSLTRDDFTQRQIGWMQEVPNRDKRNARAGIAVARTQREQALLQSEQLAVRRDAGLAWLALHFAEKKLDLFDTTLGQHRLLEETAISQMSAGKISPADVSTIRLETLNLADRRDDLLRDVVQTRSSLLRWTGDSVDGVVSVVSSPTPAFKVNVSGLQTNLERNPDIAALTPLKAIAEAELREAEAGKSGDWSWGVTYGKRGQGYGDLLSVQLTFELPLSPAKRQQPMVFARQKELERIESEKSEMLRKQNQELQNMLTELVEVESKLKRVDQQAIPLAIEKNALTLAAYQAGRDKLGTLQESRKQQTELRLRALELQARQSALQWRLNNLIPE